MQMLWELLMIYYHQSKIMTKKTKICVVQTKYFLQNMFFLYSFVPLLLDSKIFYLSVLFFYRPFKFSKENRSNEKAHLVIKLLSEIFLFQTLKCSFK